MPHVALRLAVLRPKRLLPAIGPPRTAWLGFGLTGVGLILLAIASMPMLAGAATNPVCDPLLGDKQPRCDFAPEAEAGKPIGSLKTAEMPVDAQLAVSGRFVRNQTALEQLGKALFWDQQVGSDGQSCGTCHFVAGADARDKNQGSPGLKASTPDITFQHNLGPNHDLTGADFPLHKLAEPNNRLSTVLSDSNDVISSAGVFNRDFVSIQPNGTGLGNDRPAFDRRAFDTCTSNPEPQGFSIRGINTRRVEPRNTPTMINAMFSNRNFWDSRAQDSFNGVNPFGKRDTGAVVFDNADPAFPKGVPIDIRTSSLASQAVGPPLSDFEMSCRGRTFPDVGHKLLTSTSTPLAQQDVAANDSLLGPLSVSRARGQVSDGLTVTYRELVHRAFQPRWWNSATLITVPGVTGQRPQIEANFSMFWGLSVQAYMQTLRADNSEIDRFFDNHGEQLSASEFRGLVLFSSVAGKRPFPIKAPTTTVTSLLADGKTAADLRCTTCHGGPETTAASIDAVTQDSRLERMAQLSGRCAVYDAGHFHTGVRPVADDVSLGGLDPFGNSFGETQIAIDAALHNSGKSLLSLVPAATTGPGYGLAPSMALAPAGSFNCDGDNVQGTFKAPQLRNVELTGPYFHNGGQLTLRQVVDFYNRGGDFQDAREFDPNVHKLNLGEQDKNDLVSFLLALTDERVKFERAPFDHPSICVANGHPGNETSTQAGPPLPGAGPAARALFNVECHGASGANGLPSPLHRFLNADPFDPTT